MPTLDSTLDASLRDFDDDALSGALLRDFDALLAFVGPGGASVTATKHLFSGPTLPDLNAALSRPLPVAFQRPQQKSFPYIHGLYALLRSTGMAYVDESGKAPLLRLDEDVLASWRELNPAERYFALFEAWLTRMDESALVDDHPDPYGTLNRWRQLWREIPDGGRAVDKNRMYDLRFDPGLHHIAVLDLFGLVELTDATTTDDDAWRLGRIARSPLGNALFTLTTRLYDEAKGRDFWLDPDEVWLEVPLRATLQRYFPALRRGLAPPQSTFREGVHVFRVSLSQQVWRRFAVPAEAFLDVFADAILDGFDFEDPDHLDLFSVRNAYGRLVDIKHPECQDDPPFTDTVRVGDLPLRLGQRMEYLFDFGDQWRFDVRLEAVEPADPALGGPVLRASRGKAPEQYPDFDEDEE